jgi:hypothetical protein
MRVRAGIDAAAGDSSISVRSCASASLRSGVVSGDGTTGPLLWMPGGRAVASSMRGPRSATVRGCRERVDAEARDVDLVEPGQVGGGEPVDV